MQTSIYRFFLAISSLLVFSAVSISKTQYYENGQKSRPEVLNLSSSTRSIIDLSGKWNFSTDEGATWNDILVPSAVDFDGKIIFTRKFDLPAYLLAAHSLKFVAYGINYQAEVYLNEVFIGKHEGGYSSFSFLVPENTLQLGGENVIRVVVDNSLNSKSTLPLRQQIGGWKSYGGIFRDVFLVATPPVWIDDLTVAPEDLDPKVVKLLVKAVVSSRDLTRLTFGDRPGAAPMTLTVEVSEKVSGLSAGKSIPVTFTPETNRDVVVESTVLVPNPKMWNPDQPSLYTIRATISTGEGKAAVVLDEYKMQTGIRTIGKEKQNVVLNGVPVLLRGIAWCEDSPDQGSALSVTSRWRKILP